MADLTAIRTVSALGCDAVPKYAPVGSVAASATIYQNSLVFMNSSGYLVAASPDQTMTCSGYCDVAGGVDNSAGSAGDETLAPRIGPMDLANGTAGDAISEDDRGKMAYAVDNQTAGLTNGSNTRAAIGPILGMQGTRVLVLAGMPGNREIASVTSIATAPVVTVTSTALFSGETNLGALADGLLAIDVTAGTAAVINRSMAVGSAALTVANADGQAGNPTYDGSVALKNVSALAGTGLIVQSGGAANNGTFVERSIAVSGAGLSVANGDGVAANPTLSLANGVAALEALAGTGVVVHTAADTYTERSIAVSGTAITIANGDGVAANPTISPSVAVANLSALAGTGLVVQSGGAADNGTFVERSVAVGSAALTVANGSGVAANPTLDASVALKAISAFAGTGAICQTGGIADNGTFAERSFAVGSAALTITNPAGVAGNPTYDASVGLGNVSALAGTGLLVQSGGAAHNGTFVERSIAVSGAGLSIANGDGVAANPTISLANGVAALEALAGTGIVVHTAADTYTERSIAVGGPALSIADPTGVAANPTISASTALTNLSALASTGLLVQTGGIADAGTFTERSIAVGSTALTVTNGSGVGGNPTLNASVAGVNLSALAGTGFVAQTAGAADNGTFAERSITVGDGLDVTNPAGVAGNPLLELDDRFVRCTTLSATGGVGGATAGSLTLNLTDVDGNALGAARQIFITTSLVQYVGIFSTPIATLTFGAASAGSIIASGNGWCLAKTDATGEFTCALDDTADETVYFAVINPPGGVSLIADAAVVVGSIVDSATWAA